MEAETQKTLVDRDTIDEGSTTVEHGKAWVSPVIAAAEAGEKVELGKDIVEHPETTDDTPEE